MLSTSTLIKSISPIDNIDKSTGSKYWWSWASEILRSTFVELGFDVYGGLDAPYVFVHMKGAGSWESFSHILETIQVVTIPGAGFGPGGEGFLRMSAFAPRESCIEACNRFREMYKKQ